MPEKNKENREDYEDIKRGVSMPPGMDGSSEGIPEPESDGSEDVPSPGNIPEPGENEEDSSIQEDKSYEPSLRTTSPASSSINQGRDLIEKIHEITEAVIDEKWGEFTKKIGNLNVWQEKVNTNISSIKQEIQRIEGRFENLQKAVLGKVSEYDKGITKVHTEMKALEKVFERILDPLVNNVKELGKITEELKKIKK